MQGREIDGAELRAILPRQHLTMTRLELTHKQWSVFYTAFFYVDEHFKSREAECKRIVDYWRQFDPARPSYQNLPVSHWLQLAESNLEWTHQMQGAIRDACKLLESSLGNTRRGVKANAETSGE